MAGVNPVTPDYTRIDEALVLACDETPADERSLTVFIHTCDPPTEDQARRLIQFGMSLPAAGRRILTATLSPADVAALSNEPWIKRLKLSQRLKPADE
jgi:hypothetical protein